MLWHLCAWVNACVLGYSSRQVNMPYMRVVWMFWVWFDVCSNLLFSEKKNLNLFWSGMQLLVAVLLVSLGSSTNVGTNFIRTPDQIMLSPLPSSFVGDSSWNDVIVSFFFEWPLWEKIKLRQRNGKNAQNIPIPWSIILNVGSASGRHVYACKSWIFYFFNWSLICPLPL